MKAILAAATLAAAFTASPCWAQSAGSGNLTAADRQFLTKAGHGNAAEVAMGEMASSKATQPAVQEFGRWMQTDHTMANHQLAAAAASMRATAPPTQPDQQQQSMAQSMQQLSGAQFDQQYVQHMVSDHQQDVQDYQKEASSTHNRLLKAYAVGTLPVIQAHLAEAQQLESMNPTTTAAVSGSTATATK